MNDYDSLPKINLECNTSNLHVVFASYNKSKLVIMRDFLRDKLILWVILASLALTVSTILSVILRVDLDRTNVVTQHLIIEGQSQYHTGDANYLYTLVTLSIICLLSSFIIAYRIYNSYRLGSYLSLFFGIVILSANLLIIETLLRI